MERKSIRLEFHHAGGFYDGWATPSRDLHPDGDSASYRIVLNGVFFGNISFLEGIWLASERHAFELTQAVGNALTHSLAQAPMERVLCRVKMMHARHANVG